MTLITVKSPSGVDILKVLRGRKKKTVKMFLQSIPKKLRKTVTAVCSDMYSGFIYSVVEVFKSNKILVLDRFHVAQSYRKIIDRVRKKEMKRLKNSLTKSQYNELQNVMWILRKKSENLDDSEQKTLVRLFYHSPLLKKIYELCQSLTEFFNSKITRSEAKQKIKRWIQKTRKKDITYFTTFIKTLEKYLEYILNYFSNRYNSGFVEGFNGKVKALIRRCYGIHNAKTLFKRVYLELHYEELCA